MLVKQIRTEWQDHYLRGAGMEMYTEHFSEAFHGPALPISNRVSQYFSYI